MNITSQSNESPLTNVGSHSNGGFRHGIWLTLGVVIVFIIVTCMCYKYKRMHGGTTALNHNFSTHRTSISTTTTTNNHPPITTIQQNGLDEATLSSYPKFTYSQLIKPHNKTTCDLSTTVSACSVCLADYKDTDLLRLLPECGHLFHLTCIDPWLMLHPTCPVCRNSPLMSTLQTSLSM